jgi:hypothetical protein
MHKPNATATLNYPFPQQKDDTLTISAISVLAAIIASILHEGFGHAATALLTGAESGLLTTVSWSSAQESRLVAASGTLVNLVAALLFWLALRNAPLRSLAPSSVLMSGLQSLRLHGLFLFLWRHNFGADFP